ncbi:hypothetical protein K493DRAFT_209790 [Basidiobolus meristosporus CBS 931.73]|uniref:Amino acid transporter transmembrane domain-containing protein n=1 Tax=Basidiobolus meristosporus CBS 931.73 TaxID=1314790 RepID=A0A1Y1XX25_9FUNG|nr:hypothetical protein K493DRAFT_231691 [Basidiobolus meristosporus CBS 931.73]ORY01307.1 hypothetical protein K493DRAFT_209790 [Basidiobolus meristosporus CBS 931.73]|eukprot:ORX90046.1 hypothetical protein K493DRAFT_231691 [Basidiobolus meristosporus CBS 931.73]
MEYDSHAGDHDRNGSSFGAYFNIVCAIAGTGTLQLPYALSQSGWVGVGLILLSTGISIYTGSLLIKCLYYDRVSRLSDYSSIGKAAFGKPGMIFIRVFHYSIQIGSAIVYILITGLNAHQLFEAMGVVLDQKVWVLIAGVIVWIPYILLKTLKEVAILSVLGVLSTLVLVFVAVSVSLIDLPNNVQQTHQTINISGFPIALASICFSFGGNVVYPHVEQVMAHPKSWNKVLRAAMLTICVLYLLISVAGYYVYGGSTKSPIYDSLPAGPATTVAIIMITFHVLLACPIYLTSFATEIEAIFRIDSTYYSKYKERILRFALRTGILAVLTVIAMFLPYISDFMSLFGALSNTVVVFIAPIVLYWKLFGWRSMSKLELLWCGVILLVAAVGCVLGTKDAITSLIAHIQCGSACETHVKH